MAWASALNIYIPSADSATWEARATADIRRPALFVYLDWPGGEVRASTFHRSVTVDEGSSPSPEWTGVGNFAFFETSAAQRSSAQITHRIGLTSLPEDAITEATEAAAIGRRALIYEGLFDEAWANPVLKQIFIGHIISAGDFKHSRDDKGNWTTSAWIEVSNGRSPRRQLENHHSPETAEAGDTAWRLLPTVARILTWPGGD